MRKMVVAIVLSLALTSASTKQVAPDPRRDDTSMVDQPVLIRATCYCDRGITASGHVARYGVVAAAPKYLPDETGSYIAYIYQVESDGSIGDLIDIYDVYDTGYGFDTHEGKSSVVKGMTMGSIEAEESIDIFMEENMISDWQKKYGDYVYCYLVKGNG